IVDVIASWNQTPNVATHENEESKEPSRVPAARPNSSPQRTSRSSSGDTTILVRRSVADRRDVVLG
ncbi:MAG: hypothetical protein AAFP90_10305, partial [Planctomycetota bacterium]